MTKMELAVQIKDRIIENINPISIVLFGSVAQRKDHENSDIDLLIVWDEKKELSIAKRRVLLRGIIGIVESPLDVLTCTSEELYMALDDKNSFTSKIVAEGETIYGRLNRLPEMA